MIKIEERILFVDNFSEFVFNTNSSKKQDLKVASLSRLLKAFSEHKWIALEYNHENYNYKQYVEWIEKMHIFAAKHGHQFIKTVVFINERQIQQQMRVVYNGAFGEAGSICKFYDGLITDIDKALSEFVKDF